MMIQATADSGVWDLEAPATKTADLLILLLFFRFTTPLFVDTVHMFSDSILRSQLDLKAETRNDIGVQVTTVSLHQKHGY